MDSKPTSVPLDGYSAFLLSQKRYRDLSEKHLAHALADALGMSQFTWNESCAINLSARLILTTLTAHGIELMFNDRDDFLGVVT